MGWYVLTLTDSPFLVGLTWSARMSLNIFALFAGAIADRLPRNRILAAVEFIIAALGLIMILLILNGRIQVWHIFGVAMAAGVVRVFQMPSAQSLVADTLPQDRIGNGAAFNSVGMNIAMLLGPLIGGVLFKSYGPEGAYAMITALYCLSGLVALFIRVDRKAAAQIREPVLRAIFAGLKYVKGEQVIWGTLMFAVIIEFFGWTFHTGLLPVFAQDVLETDSAGLGVLMFAFGFGALTGSVGLAMVRNLRHVGKFMFAGAILWHASILVISTSHSFYLSMGILVFIGMGFGSIQVFNAHGIAAGHPLRLSRPGHKSALLGDILFRNRQHVLRGDSRDLGTPSGRPGHRYHGNHPDTNAGSSYSQVAPVLRRKIGLLMRRL